MTALLVIGQILAIHAALSTMPVEIRPLIRYLAMPPGMTEAEASKFGNVISGHCNGLSREPDLVIPQRVDGLLRINLSDYGWTRELWDSLAEDEPYYHVTIETKLNRLWPGGIWPGDGKFYASGSFTVMDWKQRVTALAPWLGDKEKVADVVRWMQAKSPVYRADWFVHRTVASEGRKVGYYGMLGVKNQKDFESLIRFSAPLAKDLEQRRVVNLSGIALQPRRVQRDVTVLGGHWSTFDNADATGEHDPLTVLNGGLKFDATEKFAPLPNGMPAWLLADAQGNLQGKAPDNVVGGDKLGGGNDTRLHVNLSCYRCHFSQKGEDGVKEIAALQIANISSQDYEKVRELRRLYFRDVQPLIFADRKGYATAIKAATGMEGHEYAAGLQEVFSRYEDGRVTAAVAAREIGTTEKEFVSGLAQYAKMGYLHPALTVLKNGGFLQRRQWEVVYVTAREVMGYK